MNYRNFLRFPGFKLRAVTLSYDDGVVQDERLIKIMKENGLKGTFNINSGLFAPIINPIRNQRFRMTKDESYKLYSNSGMEVAVHGYKHIYLNEVDSARATFEILKDREELESIFGGVIQGMAYAYGEYNDKIVQILKDCGIKYSRTVISTEDFVIPTDFLRMPTTCHHNNPRLFELVDKFLEPIGDRRWQNSPRLFYLWGHSYEFDNNDNWDVIEKFAKTVGNREDIWYATNIEIYNYVTAFDRLEYSVDGKTIYNPSAIDLYLNISGDLIVPAGQTIKL